jgi:preprotein translocase subunit SecA
MTTLQQPSVRATEWLGREEGSPEAARLWPMLSGSHARRQPAKGFDVFGEAVTGWWARRKARRLDWGRARAIVNAAKKLATLGESLLDEEVKEARAGAILDRHGRGAIDRAFAVGYEAVRREVGLSLHVEQVLGALALAEGCCAELATGEGKTVTAILPAALDGWLGRGLHVITVNDYLARRDAEITSPAYRRLGLSVGVIQETTTREGRRRTYGPDKQILFDHLRDRLLAPLAPRLSGLILSDIAGDEHRPEWGSAIVQRGLFAAIVDEADSVLIDDSVTPAIISAPTEQAAGQEHFLIAAELARRLEEPEHYTVDSRLRRVTLTDGGRERLAELARRLPAFWAGPRRREELLVQAVYAKELYRRGEDYIVKGDAVLIVDRSTGRILPGRQWQLGLHQAVEAKEGLKITVENVAVARSSYQAFFQKYRRLSGMTGTAREVANEMWAWYRLPVVRIPTHKPVIRTKAPDRVFVREGEKLEAAADRVV